MSKGAKRIQRWILDIFPKKPRPSSDGADSKKGQPGLNTDIERKDDGNQFRGWLTNTKIVGVAEVEPGTTQFRHFLETGEYAKNLVYKNDRQ